MMPRYKSLAETTRLNSYCYNRNAIDGTVLVPLLNYKHILVGAGQKSELSIASLNIFILRIDESQACLRRHISHLAGLHAQIPSEILVRIEMSWFEQK